MLARAQEKAHARLSALRGIVPWGRPFERPLAKIPEALNSPNIFNGYGTTETFWNTFLRPFDLPDMAGSAGRSCTDDDVRLVALREDGSHAEPEDIGSARRKTLGRSLSPPLRRARSATLTIRR